MVIFLYILLYLLQSSLLLFTGLANLLQQEKPLQPPRRLNSRRPKKTLSPRKQPLKQLPQIDHPPNQKRRFESD